MTIRKWSLMVVGLSVTQALWAAPTLTVGKVTGKAGSDAVLPISFDPGGAKVTAAQFSLILPSALSAGTVALGPAANQAGKIVTAKQVGQKWNVIIMGMNQTPIDAGNLINATVKIASSAAAGKLAVKVVKPVYSDGGGHSITAGPLVSGSINVSPSAP